MIPFLRPFAKLFRFHWFIPIGMCSYYSAGRTYLKLYKNNSEFKYDFCIAVKSFLIEN